MGNNAFTKPFFYENGLGFFVIASVSEAIPLELALRIDGISAAHAFAIQSDLLTSALKKSGM